MTTRTRSLGLSAVVVMWLLAVAGPVAAQQGQEPLVGSFLTPFPENDTYRMVVMGDDFAEGILEGLREAIGPETRVEVPRKNRWLGGLNRPQFDEERKWIEDPTVKDVYHIAVIVVGRYDSPSLNRTRSQRPRASDWLEAYGRRVDQLAKALKKRRIAVYWVGLPGVRRSDVTDDHQVMNEVIREKVFLNGQKYIDIFNGFADDAGSFDTYGPDLKGNMRKMRENDGVLFTWDGNKKLAHFVEREIKRDIVQARAERTIPLAGSEEEQLRLAPRKAAPKDSTAAGKQAAAPATAGTPPTGRSFVLVPTPSAAEPGTEQKADNSRISLRVTNAQGKDETVAMDLPRPAINASVMALVTRQHTASKPSQLGDSVLDEIAGGVTVLSSITPVSVSGRRSLTSTQAPHYKVLVKGERLNPKLGRVDDFSWPPPALVDAPALPAPASVPQGPRTSPDQPAPRKGLRQSRS